MTAEVVQPCRCSYWSFGFGFGSGSSYNYGDNYGHDSVHNWLVCPQVTHTLLNKTDNLRVLVTTTLRFKFSRVMDYIACPSRLHSTLSIHPRSHFTSWSWYKSVI